MRTLKLNIPDSFEFDDREVSMMIFTRLYEQGKLSHGHGLTKRTFADADKLGLTPTENQ